MKHVVIWIALALSASPSLGQTTWYVDDDAAPGPGTGTPDDPFYRIQSAVNAAADGDTILVLPGTYPENVDFTGKALSLVSQGGPDVTTIQGQLNETVLLIDSSMPKSVLVQGLTVTGGKGHSVSFDYLTSAGGGIYASGVDLKLDNDTITHNQAGGGGGVYVLGGTAHVVTGCRITENYLTQEYGAGLVLVGTTGLIENSTFKSNSNTGFVTGNSGGGLYARNSQVAIIGDEFVDNHVGSDGSGSAIWCNGTCFLSDCWIHENGGTIDYYVVGIGRGRIDRTTIENNLGLGLSAGNALITRCTIRGNAGCDAGGGGIAIGHTVMKDCVIENNQCLNYYGAGPGGVRISSIGGGLVNCLIRNNEGYLVGGMAITSVSRHVMVLNCRIEGNRATSNTTGGIVVSGLKTKIVNCVITGNQGQTTAAINAYDTLIQGCTVSRNECATGNAVTGSYLDLRNDIVWDDQVLSELVPQVQVRAGYCNIAGGWPGLGILNIDPLFVAPDAGDFHLSLGSPLIDRGQDHVPVSVGIDIDGERRIRGSHIDIGADEAN